MKFRFEQEPKEIGQILREMIWPGLPNLLINILATGKKLIHLGDEPRVKPGIGNPLGGFGKTGGPRRS